MNFAYFKTWQRHLCFIVIVMLSFFVLFWNIVLFLLCYYYKNKIKNFKEDYICMSCFFFTYQDHYQRCYSTIFDATTSNRVLSSSVFYFCLLLSWSSSSSSSSSRIITITTNFWNIHPTKCSKKKICRTGFCLQREEDVCFAFISF